jgi:hypothetical protein
VSRKVQDSVIGLYDDRDMDPVEYQRLRERIQALDDRTPSVALNTHALRDLQSTYNKLYTEDRFRWELPFRTEYLGFTAQEVETLLKRERPVDQMYRYPIDRKGNPWRGVVGFEAKEFLRKLQNIKEDFCRLEKQIFASIKTEA